MTPPSADDLHRVALEMERLNGTVQQGFTAVRGDINLLARAEYENGQDIDKLDTRLGKLEERRWPLQITQGVMSVAAVAVAGYVAVGKG
jgi:hypothetical protein